MNRKNTMLILLLLVLPKLSVGETDSQVKGVPDCGPHCIRFLSRYYDRPVTLEEACELCVFTPDSNSTSMLELKQACQKLGLHCFGFKGPLKTIQEAPFNDCSFIMLTTLGKNAHWVVITRAKNSDRWFLLDSPRRLGYQLVDKYFANSRTKLFLAVSDAPINPTAGASIVKSLASQPWKISVFALTMLAGLFLLARKVRRIRQCRA